MKICETDISGDTVVEMIPRIPLHPWWDRFGMAPIDWKLSNDLVVEGLVFEWHEIEGGIHVKMLMTDEHAERLAVSPDMRGPVEFVEGEL